MWAPRRYLFPLTRAWVARRSEAAERLEQLAIEACLDDCANDEERDLSSAFCANGDRQDIASQLERA